MAQPRKSLSTMSRKPWAFLSRLIRKPADHPDRRAGDDARDRRDWAAAAAAYRRYLAVRPTHSAVWLRLGNMLKEQNLGDEADASYAEAARHDPTSGVAWRMRGQLAERRGDKAALGRAAEYYAKAWGLDRDAHAGFALTRPEQRRNLGRLQVGRDWRIEGAVDGLRNLTLEGWAWSPEEPDVPAWIDIWLGGQKIGSARADRYRFDISDAGLAPAQCGFAFELGSHLDAASTALTVEVCRADGMALAASPFDLGETAGLRRWLQRPRSTPEFKPPSTPLISILTPVHDVRTDWFEDVVSGVSGQSDGRWEWVIVDDGSASLRLRERLVQLAVQDPRIRVETLAQSLGAAAATNVALSMARADHVLFLDHDDQLEPEAVARMLGAVDADLIYGDEMVTGSDIRDLRMLAARPAFSWRYYLSHPYFVHPVCVRRSLAMEIGGFNETMAISADVDFMLRLFEKKPVVAHVPGILYRWRTHGGSLGHIAATEATTATLAALGRHLGRLGIKARVGRGPVSNTFKVDFADPGGRVLVVIPTRDRCDLLKVCIDSIWRTCAQNDVDIVVIDHESVEPETLAYLDLIKHAVRVLPYVGAFNYARMNNIAVAEFGSGHKFVLFLNNDIEALTSGWLGRLRALASMDDVGAVGATLLYPDNRVQHAGVIIGPGGFAEHAMKFAQYEIEGRRNPGYNCNLVSVRDWSAVTGACLMMRTEVFQRLSGFDEAFPVGFNDTDLCLRVRSAGLKVINDGWAVLRHHESATRASGGDLGHPEDAARFAFRWADLIAAGDPFYNPVLSLDRDHQPEHPDTDRLDARFIRPVAVEPGFGG